MTHIGQQHNGHIRSEKPFDSFTGNFSPSSNPTSSSTSPSLNTSDSPPLNVYANLVNEAFSQLKVLDTEGGDLDKAMAIVSRLAGKVSEPSQPMTQAPIEGQDLRSSMGSYFIEPRWSPERSLNSSQDRATAVLINRRSTRAKTRDVPSPAFFKHCIRFVPRPTEQDFYRTVVISGLPLSITMEAVLERVRGGIVIDAKLLNTADITDSNTALVSFLHEYSALAFEDYAQRYPIVSSNVLAQVAVIPPPTWPIPINLRKSIEEGRTRYLQDIWTSSQRLSTNSTTRAYKLASYEINQRRVYEAKSRRGPRTTLFLYQSR